VYLHARVVFSNVSKEDKRASLLEISKSWMAWDDISTLANHECVRERLQDFLNRTNESHEAQYHDPEVRFHYTH
jgi:hypothetical protein